MRLALVLLLALPAFAHEGWGLVVHDRLGVVVSDIPGNTIWRIDEDGEKPLLRNIHSHALIHGADGAIWGTDPDTNRIWSVIPSVVEGSGGAGGAPDRRTDPSTTLGMTRVIAPPTLGLQSFLITRDGSIYSANRYDHRKPTVVLMKRDQNGQIAVVARDFESIDGIREAADGSLVVVDGASLRVGNRKLGPLTRKEWGEDLLGLSSVEGDVVHVADHAGRRILRVTLDSGATTIVDRSSFWWAPAGVEHANGSLYVLEHLRPPLALLGDLEIGPYLRVRRGSETLAVVWGRKTWILLVPLLFVLWLIRRYFFSNTLSIPPARM